MSAYSAASRQHLAAENGDGSFTAFRGVTSDSVNKVAIFEPVGTRPDDCREGLARAQMCQGLRRVTVL